MHIYVIDKSLTLKRLLYNGYNRFDVITIIRRLRSKHLIARQEEARAAFRALGEEFRDRFWGTGVVAERKASAWYVAAYRARSLPRVLSFAWLVPDSLVQESCTTPRRILDKLARSPQAELKLAYK